MPQPRPRAAEEKAITGPFGKTRDCDDTGCGPQASVARGLSDPGPLPYTHMARILLIEDDQAQREILRLILEKLVLDLAAEPKLEPTVGWMQEELPV